MSNWVIRIRLLAFRVRFASTRLSSSWPSGSSSLALLVRYEYLVCAFFPDEPIQARLCRWLVGWFSKYLSNRTTSCLTRVLPSINEAFAIFHLLFFLRLLPSPPPVCLRASGRIPAPRLKHTHTHSFSAIVRLNRNQALRRDGKHRAIARASAGGWVSRWAVGRLPGWHRKATVDHRRG